jgi:hypothetical protein
MAADDFDGAKSKIEQRLFSTKITGDVCIE